MTLGEKIQMYRKMNNLSQEELAAELGVSRQALSKWECGSSNPDISNIVAISRYFHITTDSLLLDEAAISNQEAVVVKTGFKMNVIIPIIIGSVIIAIGLIVAIAKGNDGTLFYYWSFSSMAPGLMIQVLGIGLFEILFYSYRFENKRQYLFWCINTWLLTVVPMILGIGLLHRYGIIYHYRDLHMIFYMGVGYFIFNVIVTFILVFMKNNKRKTQNIV